VLKLLPAVRRCPRQPPPHTLSCRRSQVANAVEVAASVLTEQADLRDRLHVWNDVKRSRASSACWTWL